MRPIDCLRDEFKTDLFDRGSSNLVRDFLIKLGIQVIRSGIFNQVAQTQTRCRIQVLDFVEVRSADE